MRYRVPEDCTSVTLDGVVLIVRDGFIEAEAAAASELAAHEIVPAEPKPEKAEEKPGSRRART